MIKEIDEYLHELKGKTASSELYHFNFIDKKSKVFGFADITLNSRNRKIDLAWSIQLDDKRFSYRSRIDAAGLKSEKRITDGHFDYRIAASQGKFKLTLKNEEVNASFDIASSYPIYEFPKLQAEDIEGQKLCEDINLWDHYEQRCRFSGTVAIKKGVTRKVDCFGHRYHSWGNMLTDRVTCKSILSIQFKDMEMNLFFLEVGGASVSNGFISRRSGNIPINKVDLELMSFDKSLANPVSTEFSYRDAQDDVDLIVSRRLHTVELPVPDKLKGQYIWYRNFSDFTVIGSNKKGVGLEDHFISVARLKSMD